MLPPNTTQPLGIAITSGYDSIHPLGILKQPDGITSSEGIPLATHVLAPADKPGPEGWSESGTLGTYQLWQHPMASSTAFRITQTGGPLEPLAWEQWTMNRRRLQVPQGSKEVVIAENWHRGWFFRVDGDGWKRAVCGPDRTLRLPVGPDAAAEVEMQFRPFPSRMPLLVSVGALALTGIYLLGGRTRRDPSGAA